MLERRVIEANHDLSGNFGDLALYARLFEHNFRIVHLICMKFGKWTELYKFTFMINILAKSDEEYTILVYLGVCKNVLKF